jgi:serine/threonine protein phosphatase PrpC
MASAKHACETLLQEALDGGGSDNVTVLLVRQL